LFDLRYFVFRFGHLPLILLDLLQAFHFLLKFLNLQRGLRITLQRLDATGAESAAAPRPATVFLARLIVQLALLAPLELAQGLDERQMSINVLLESLVGQLAHFSAAF